jgi:hypothetical protein
VPQCKTVPVLNYASHRKDVWRSGRLFPRRFQPYFTWKWVVSFTPQSLYPWWSHPPIDIELKTGRVTCPVCILCGRDKSRFLPEIKPLMQFTHSVA